jgi:tetratricopeptide (TPR) repeat protein
MASVNAYAERIQWLLDQQRYALALEQLHQWLSESPEKPIIHAFLALCHSELQQAEPALHHAQTAVALGPDLSYSHYILGVVQQDKGQWKAAHESFLQALQLDPEDPDYHTRLGLLFWQQGQWSPALRSAETALRYAPDHIDALNLRSMSLVRLGATDQAVDNMNTALGHDPENPRVHTNRGWSLLYANDHAKALDAFREALRLDPGMAWAQEGMLEALKARYRLYRAFQRYRFWASRYGARQQLWVMILWVIALRALFAYTGTSWPALTLGVMGVYFGLVLMTWLIDPLFNLVLSFDAHGKYLLSAREHQGARLMGGMLAAGVLLCVTGLLSTVDSLLLSGVFCFLMLVPAASTQATVHEPHREILRFYTLFLSILALGTVTSFLLGAQTAFMFSMICFGVSWLAFSWLANLLLLKSPH